MALADEKTYSDQGFWPAFMKPSNSMARRLCRQEILVHHEERFHVQLRFHLRHDAEEFLAGVVEIQELALPPKKAEVVQKLQPMGQPTEGMMVAAVRPLSCGRFIPMVRPPKPETISGGV